MAYYVHGLGAVSYTDHVIAAENALAPLMRPLYPAIDKLELPPYLDAGWRDRAKTRPITALLQLFEPFENVTIEVIDEANRLSGKMMRTIGLPGGSAVNADMRVHWPGDEKLDVAVRDYVRRLRIVSHYMLLVHQAPQFLTAAATKVAAKYGMAGTALLRAGLQQLAANLPPVPSLPPPPAPPAPPRPSVPSAPSRPSWMHGLGALPLLAAVEAWLVANKTIVSLGLTAAGILVPALVTLILVLGKPVAAAAAGAAGGAGAGRMPAPGMPGGKAPAGAGPAAPAQKSTDGSSAGSASGMGGLLPLAALAAAALFYFKR